MSMTRTLRNVAAGLVILLSLVSLCFLVTEPGSLSVDSPFGAKLAEGFTLGAVFLPTLLAGPLVLLCAGALVVGAVKGGTSTRPRRPWLSLLLLWFAGLMLPLLLGAPPVWVISALLLYKGAPVGIGLLMLLAVGLKIKGRRGAGNAVVAAAILALPFLSQAHFVWRLHPYASGATWLSCGLGLAALLIDGRARRWLLRAALLLAFIGTLRTLRTHMGAALASLDLALLAAWLLHRQARALVEQSPHAATRLGLHLAPLALATTWFGMLALAGDNCVLLAYLQGLSDPAVDLGVCSGLYPTLLWDLNDLYRVLFILGTLPLVGLALHWRPTGRRRWVLAVACAASAVLLKLFLQPGVSFHFRGRGTDAVAHASCENAEGMIAAGAGLRDYKGRKGHWEYKPWFDPDEYGETDLLMDIPDRFVKLLLQPPDNTPSVTARSWFPETLLFEPIVVTDADGLAALEVPVPDQLTRWRLLALAHSRSGRQAGTEASFVSTLPIAIELVEPPTLRTGDRVRLPVRVVNNQDEPWTGPLTAEASGSARGSIDTTLHLEPHSSAVRFLEVDALTPGPATLTVQAGPDRVERSLVVGHTGRLDLATHSGTLAGPRAIELTTPIGALPGSRVALTIYPGPMGFLEQEAQRQLPRDVDGAAYALALTGRGQLIAQRMGAALDPDEAKDARVRARLDLGSLLIRRDVLEAVVAMSAVAPRVDPTMASMAADLGMALQRDQLMDGSYELQQASLERSLVMAAEAARVSHTLAPIVTRRAAGYLERHAPRVRDPYTAAVLAASGAVEEPQLTALRGVVREAVTIQDDGSAVVEPHPLSVRLDGRRPGVVETTARAVTALAGDPGSTGLVSDLGAALMGSYDPRRGFGDGIASMAVLDAFDRLFRDPLPERVELTLSIDGEIVQTRMLALGGGFAPQRLEAPAPTAPGSHRYTIEAAPNVSGLAYSLERSAWLPWSTPEDAGFSVQVQTPTTATVGRPVTVRVLAAAPAGERFELIIELPVGVEIGEHRAAEGLGVDLASRQGVVFMDVDPLSEGQSFAVDLDLIPTMAGELQWGAASLELRDSEGAVSAPVGWMKVLLPSPGPP